MFILRDKSSELYFQIGSDLWQVIPIHVLKRINQFVRCCVFITSFKKSDVSSEILELICLLKCLFLCIVHLVILGIFQIVAHPAHH